jgi:hypothetical protein
MGLTPPPTKSNLIPTKPPTPITLFSCPEKPLYPHIILKIALTNQPTKSNIQTTKQALIWYFGTKRITFSCTQEFFHATVASVF